MVNGLSRARLAGFLACMPAQHMDARYCIWKATDYTCAMSAQTLGFAVQPEDRPLLDELVAYFGNGNRSAYLRATLRIMRSVMLADQLRDLQAYGQQRTAELGIEPTDVPARVREFLKGGTGPDGQ
jgi:hypothetical protein